MAFSQSRRFVYQTAQAANADTAFDEIIVRPANVVFCDVQTPGKSGFWPADRLSERFPETAVILTSGDTKVPPVTSLQAGVVGYLMMPFDREAVLEALRIGVQWHEMFMAVRAKKDDGTDSIQNGSRLKIRGDRCQQGHERAAPKGSRGTFPRAAELEKQLRLPCMEILEALLNENFRRRTSDGLFVRSGAARPSAA
jgi:DNA-binding response OmpR family regulator